MRAYESASDKAQHAAADDARRALTDLAREVRTLHERGALERPDAPASERARVLYLRGRLLDAVGAVPDAKGARENDAGSPDAVETDEKSASHDTSDEKSARDAAEDLLKRAAKLDPALDGAWLTLAQALWKKNDLQGARHCYDAVLAKRPHKKALCALSMLCRGLAKSRTEPGSDAQKALVRDSVRFAKAAVKLDVDDGHAWYQVGTATTSAFFAQGATDIAMLKTALKAYEHAEKGGPTGAGALDPEKHMRLYPDVHFNRAVLCRYVERYDDALASFAEASRLDPALPTKPEVDAVLAALAKLDDGCRGLGPQCKPKRVAATARALREESARRDETERFAHEGTSYATRAGAADLREGANVGVAVRARAVLDATANGSANGSGSNERHSESVAPKTLNERRATRDVGALNLHYVAVDARGDLFAVSVYGLEDGAVRLSATLTLLNPDVRDVDVTWNGRRYAFRLVRVDLPKQILVGGKMPVGRIARPRMASTNL